MLKPEVAVKGLSIILGDVQLAQWFINQLLYKQYLLARKSPQITYEDFKQSQRTASISLTQTVEFYLELYLGRIDQ